MTEFVRASRLYDVEAGTPLGFGWAAMRPLAENRQSTKQYREGQ
ncbi:hypothetical protein [Halomicrobium katesii]|nr:hypothetical protein [Halomicrobium katesii]